MIANSNLNSQSKSTSYIKCEENVILNIALYGDDMQLTRPNEMHICKFKLISSNVKFGPLAEFKQCNGGIALCHTKYIEALLQGLALRIPNLLQFLWRRI